MPKTKTRKTQSGAAEKKAPEPRKAVPEPRRATPEPKRAVPEPKRNTQNTADILSGDLVVSLKEQLLQKRQRILDLYAADVRAGQEATQEGTDDIVDRANNSYNRELMFSLSSAEREQLLEVDAALQRLDAGTYGFCQYSGKPIAVARLQAIPWARYSIEYQELAEKGLLEEDSGQAI